MDQSEIVARVLFGLVAAFSVAGAVWLVYDGNALRDSGTVPEGGALSFSLARVQLWFWTCIILGSYLAVAIATGKTWELNPTCLILLGISATTTTGARILDGRTNPFGTDTTPHPTENFLKDILSDDKGVSIHRFQTVVFTLAYGVWFVNQVVANLANGTPGFPSLDDYSYGLLGISSATYLALKAQEGSSAAPAPQADPDGILSDHAEVPQG